MNFQKDSYYINKVKEGDPSAYAFLVDKHKSMAFNVALQLSGSKEDAEEIAQDAFFKAYQALANYKGDSKFSTWIYRIVYNTAISYLRKKRLPTNSIDEDVSPVVSIEDTQSALQGLKQEERKKFLNMALEQLERLDKVVLTLFYLEERSIDEVSEITQLSKANTKVKLHRARKRLYSELHKLLQGELRAIL